jgi:hypothetical protein
MCRGCAGVTGWGARPTAPHTQRPDTTNSFFGEFVSPAGGRRKKIRVIHSVPDLGGFGVSFAHNSFHPAARNETLFEAASLQAGLQVHCWVKQAHGDGSCSHTNSCRANSCCSAHSMLPPCHPPPTHATTTCHLHPACNHPACLPCALATCRCSRSLARCSSRNHLARGSGLKKFKSWSSPAA